MNINIFEQKIMKYAPKNDSFIVNNIDNKHSKEIWWNGPDFDIFVKIFNREIIYGIVKNDKETKYMFNTDGIMPNCLIRFLNKYMENK